MFCFDLAVARSEITPEHISANSDDARFAENADNQPLAQRIIDDGPDGQRIDEPSVPRLHKLLAGSIICP